MLQSLIASAQEAAPSAAWQMNGATGDETATGPITLASGSYAVFHTSDGEFIVQLFPDKTPAAVENFVGLATGRKKWRHPITLAEQNEPLYNDTTIYEIVKDVLVRGGDPINKGTGGPGYNLEIETAPDLDFHQPGILAMQRSGDQANGSRWFITLTPFQDWSDRFSIIGKVIAGLDVVRAISHKPTKRPFIPLEPTQIQSIEILEIPQGRQTTANFSTEDGRKVITVDKNFQPARQPETSTQQTAQPATPVAETTGTEQVTTATVEQ